MTGFSCWGTFRLFPISRLRLLQALCRAKPFIAYHYYSRFHSWLAKILMSLNVGTVDLPIDDFVERMFSYFSATEDRKSKIWMFRDDVPSRFFKAPFCAGD